MTDASARLQRLETYLLEDPRNPALLADACDAALAAGRAQQAIELVARAQALGLADSAWTFRRAHACIAARQLDEADQLLQQMRSELGEYPALLHDLAYVRFLRQDFAACRVLLAPALAEPGTDDQRDALQALWLRASHADGRVDEAWTWIQAQPEGALGPIAAGVAALVAIDHDDFDAARSLAEQALARSPAHPEALVARASVALADHAPREAIHGLEQVLARHPDDGRTWAMLGLANLQLQHLAAARWQLERAVQCMPAHIGSWHALGWTRLLQNDREAARAAFERALALDDNFAESHAAVGLALLLGNAPERAAEHLRIAMRLDPQNVTGRFVRALQAGEVADAQRLQALAHRLLDRPGFGGAPLATAFRRALGRAQAGKQPPAAPRP